MVWLESFDDVRYKINAQFLTLVCPGQNRFQRLSFAAPGSDSVAPGIAGQDCSPQIREAMSRNACVNAAFGACMISGTSLFRTSTIVR